jgi:hypothetical protein
MQMNCLITSSRAERLSRLARFGKAGQTAFECVPAEAPVSRPVLMRVDPCLQNRGNRLYYKLRSEF